jgi:hypothetical protein
MTSSTITAGRAVDAGTTTLLRTTYANLIKAGQDSVRAAWLFGQLVASLTDKVVGHSVPELAAAINVSPGTLYRYRRLYLAYQRVELAVQASEQLGTFDISIIWELQNQRSPLAPARPMAGRRFRSYCTHCRSSDVARVEIDPDTEQPLVPLDELLMIGAGAGGGV